jgi:hypothetical protein
MKFDKTAYITSINWLTNSPQKYDEKAQFDIQLSLTIEGVVEDWDTFGHTTMFMTEEQFVQFFPNDFRDLIRKRFSISLTTDSDEPHNLSSGKILSKMGITRIETFSDRSIKDGQEVLTVKNMAHFRCVDEYNVQPFMTLPLNKDEYEQMSSLDINTPFTLTIKIID